MPPILHWFLRLGPVNPVAVRLVQGGSRRRRHMYIRAAYLGVLMVVLLYALLLSTNTGGGGGGLSYRQLASAGAQAFEFTAYLQIGLICLLAPVFMAGAIAQEANPKTWDILLTTPLSAAEIVLGNLLGRLFFILALLVSSLPLFALTQYFGGVPGRAIFASYLIAACAALLVGAMAIALSVSRLVGKRAVFAFYVCTVSYLAITWAADAIVGIPGKVSPMTAINPFLALRALLNPTGYARYAAGDGAADWGGLGWMVEQPVTAWCVLSGGLSLMLIIASTLTVRAGGIAGLGGQGGRGEGGAGKKPWYLRLLGLSGKGVEHRPPRNVWHNPIAWREAAARNATLGRMVARYSFIVLGVLWALGIVLYFHGGSMPTATFRQLVFYTVMGEMIVLALVAVNMAATAVAKEREDGTLDLLLTTPLTPRDYLGGKIRGMVAYLIPLIGVPVGTLLIAGAYVGLAQVGLVHPPGGVSVDPTENAKYLSAVNVAYTPVGTSVRIAVPAVLPEAPLVLAIVAVPFIAFCCMVGLMWSVKSKGSIGSVIATVGVVGVVSGIVGLCAFKAGESVPMIGPIMSSLSPGTAVFGSVYPEDALAQTVADHGIAAARLAQAIGAVIAAAAYFGVVYALRASTVHNFDMTVRRLAGTS